MTTRLSPPGIQQSPSRYLRLNREKKYKFGPISYRTDEVLNDRPDSPTAMNWGEVLQSLILAYGCEPIPSEIENKSVAVQFTLFDSLDRRAGAFIGL
jgi:hypothetical protein